MMKNLKKSINDLIIELQNNEKKWKYQSIK